MNVNDFTFVKINLQKVKETKSILNEISKKISNIDKYPQLKKNSNSLSYHKQNCLLLKKSL